LYAPVAKQKGLEVITVIGIVNEVVKVPNAVVGVPDAVVGVPDAVVGVPDAVVGVPDAVVGVPTNHKRARVKKKQIIVTYLKKNVDEQQERLSKNCCTVSVAVHVYDAGKGGR
jgi:hypothetical protein